MAPSAPTDTKSNTLKSLTEKEKETLRLIVRGYDAKSMARELDLSVHTVNERLRAARRKLSVTSSREAARLLLEHEGEPPQFLGDKQLGDAGSAQIENASSHRTARLGGDQNRRSRIALLIGGILAMSLLLALFAFSPSLPNDRPQTIGAPQAEDSRAAAIAAEDRELKKASRDWLRLADSGDWSASYARSGSAFRELNTLKAWSDASDQARAPLGTVRSRKALTFNYVNAPPHGYRLVTFETEFANRKRAIESVTLEKEGAEWKVVGYLID